SYGNWLDVERLACEGAAPAAVHTDAGGVPLQVVTEEIRVQGAAPVQLQVRSAAAGVLLRADAEQHVCWFGAWLAQLPAATTLNLISLERAGSASAALAPRPA